MIVEVIGNLFTFYNILILNLGLAGGIMVGALPGLTSTMAIAIMLPFTFGMDPTTGMLMLLGIFCGAIYGGSITAILIKTPGTPSAAATILDGYEMAQKGKAGEALEMALKASVFGGLFSCIALIFISPILASFALKFGPAEYFALALFGISIISGVGGGSVVKGLIMGVLGLLVTTIGMDPLDGLERFTFGIENLWAGIDLIPALIGLFAVNEILKKARNIHRPIDNPIEYKTTKLSFSEFIKYKRTLLRSSVIGTFIGAVPGTGAAIAAFISYNRAKKASKTPEKFGTGYIEGVAAPEAANNAVTGSTLIPLLTLGIPGDSNAAILMGALMMQGIIPGPQIFIEQKVWVYSIMIGLIFVNIFMLLQGKFFIKAFVNVTKVSANVLLPILVVLCVVGSFAVNNTNFDIILMLVFGLIGYILSKLDFPITPMVIAIVLGPLVEGNLRRALILSEGSFSIFFTKPISLLFIVASLLSMLLPVLKQFRQKKLAQQN